MPASSEPWRPGDPRITKYIGLHDYIKKHVGRIPVRTSQLHDAVEADYGIVPTRTFLRALAKLRRIGEIIGAPEPGLSEQPRELFWSAR